uniref:Uncharacterized protein n=1 Tax=Chromera velia CCMP2878 TaxID=1169474 RepID=A0A0G4HZW6_9ALVE|eukprot:Cvel_9784.t1-p1 / transcript=Cvel_9784.t1 / gene=Cvel_9784 / organism=Chromera_velia_CCMP2878 / gene_product=hypothetical protein / transcript_product=hypothetical protein / location=Cvel_scaffold574:4966-5840(+) / protein_length=231 / sequence_SO=supercontig / SO=protein_coding / is_pseudo=false
MPSGEPSKDEGGNAPPSRTGNGPPRQLTDTSTIASLPTAALQHSHSGHRGDGGVTPRSPGVLTSFGKCGEKDREYAAGSPHASPTVVGASGGVLVAPPSQLSMDAGGAGGAAAASAKRSSEEGTQATSRSWGPRSIWNPFSTGGAARDPRQSLPPVTVNRMSSGESSKCDCSENGRGGCNCGCGGGNEAQVKRSRSCNCGGCDGCSDEGACLTLCCAACCFCCLSCFNGTF